MELKKKGKIALMDALASFSHHNSRLWTLHNTMYTHWLGEEVERPIMTAKFISADITMSNRGSTKYLIACLCQDELLILHSQMAKYLLDGSFSVERAQTCVVRE